MSGFPELVEMPQGARYSARYPMAMAFSAVKHAAQARKDEFQTPYVGHPVIVSIFVWRYVDSQGMHAGDLDEDLAIAALLHDVAEDSGGEIALNEVAALFGDRVAEIVDRCSDAKPAPGTQKAPWPERKQGHIARVQRFADASSQQYDPGSCLVLGCDKLHNLTETADDFILRGEAALERFNGGVEGTRWYYRSLREALAPALPSGLLEEIDTKLAVIRA